MTAPWPLGVNAEMDQHAAKCGLAHWNCTQPAGNRWWIRRDGLPHCVTFELSGGYPAELKMLDLRHPPGPWVFGVS